MSSLMREDGYAYSFNPAACSECPAKCCTGESGYIFVSDGEIKAISEFLGMDEDNFRKTYLFKNGYKWSIKERKMQDSYECAFYDASTNGCSVYDARPLQCRTFPFWPYFKNNIEELKLECLGVVSDV